MNKQIKLTYDGVDYILEFDRMSIKMLENAGFNYSEFLDKPMTNVELAFTGAFIKNGNKMFPTCLSSEVLKIRIFLPFINTIVLT